MLEKIFKLQAHGTTVRTEVLAGITTFLTMAYIIFVNPNVLAKTGMDHGAVFVATCIAAAIGSFIMGFYANLPVALAPGMGLNAFFTYTVVMQLGHTWQTALACVFFSGVLFIIVSLLRIREWLINAIPDALKKSIAAGIGGFFNRGGGVGWGTRGAGRWPPSSATCPSPTWRRACAPSTGPCPRRSTGS